MSQTIDSKVLEMKFDNQQFESNVQTSMNTLDRLKQSLKMEGVTQTLDGIGKSVGNVNFEAIQSGVEALQKRFSTLGIIGMRVIQNLTDAAMNFANRGLNFVSDSIVQGGIRRAMNIENAHFMLQGLLKDEEKVKVIMDQAAESVDGTAYSYDAAASAAAQFTASGVQAGEDMARALRGITGVAAMTNADYESISQVFTTVAGNGRLMGDQLLQLSSRGMNAAATLKDYFNDVNSGSKQASESVTAAIADLGTGAETTEADIRDLVSKGKISFEMFSAAMDDAFGDHAKKANETFTGAMSNIKAAFARIGADFVSPLIVQNGPIVMLFNAIREKVNAIRKQTQPLARMFVSVISSAANGLTDFIKGFEVDKPFLTFYNNLTGIKNILRVIGSVLKPVGEAFRDVFSGSIAYQLLYISRGFRDLTKQLSVSETTIENIRNTFRGVFAIFDILGQALSSVLKLLFPAMSGIGDLGSGILSFTGFLGNNIVALDNWIRENDFFNNAVQVLKNTVGPVFDNVREKITKFGNAIKDFASANFHKPDFSWLEDLSTRLSQRTSMLSKIGEIFSTVFSKIGEVLTRVAPTISRLGGIFVKTIGQVIDGLLSAFRGEGIDTLLDLVNGGALAAFGVHIARFMSSMAGMTNLVGNTFNMWKGLGGTINGLFWNLRHGMETLQATMKADVVKKIAVSIAILAGAMWVLASIDSEKLGGSIAAMTIMFSELAGAMNIFNSTFSSPGGTGAYKMTAIGFAMEEIAVAILLLASALKKVSKIDPDRLANSVMALTIMIFDLTAAMTYMSQSLGTAKASGLGMVLFAAAIYVLAGALKKIGDLSLAQIGKGLLGMAGAMAIIALSFNSFKYKDSFKIATAMLVMSAAMLIMSKALNKMGSMSLKEVGKSLLAFGGAMAVIAIAFNSFKYKDSFKIAASMLVMSAAMAVMAKALNSMGSMNLPAVAKALLAFGGAMLIISLAFNSFKYADSFKIAASMLVMSAAMAIMAKALTAMGSMKLGDVGKALLAFGGAMLIISVAFGKLSDAKMIATAGAMVIMGVAMNAMAMALTSLGSMGLGNVVVSLVALAGAFTILGVAAGLFQQFNLVPTLLGMSGALVLLGIAVAGVGAGILMLSLGLTGLAVSGVAGAAAFVASMEIMFVGVIDTIARSAEAIARAFKNVLLALIDVIVEVAPAIADGFLTMIEEICKSLAEHGPTIAGYFLDFLLNVMKEIRARLPEIVREGILLISDFFTAVFDGVAEVGVEGVGKMIGAITELAGLLLALNFLGMMIPSAMFAILQLGGLMVELTGVFAAMGVIAQIPGIGWLVDQGADFGEKIGNAIGRLIGGVLGGIAQGATSALPAIGTHLSGFMENMKPFFDALKNVDTSKVDVIGKIAGGLAKLSGANLLEGFAGWITGKSSVDSFSEALPKLAEGLTNFSDNLGDSLNDNKKIEAAGNLASMVAALAKHEIPKTGGLLQWITGESDLTGFAKSLPVLADGLTDFASNLGDELSNTEKIDAAHNVASMLAALAKNEIPNDGGVVGWITGNSSKISRFSEQLPELAKGLTRFANYLGDELQNTEKINAAANVTRMLSVLAKEDIPESSGVIGWLSGKSNYIEEFSKAIPDLAKGLTSFAESLGDSVLSDDKIKAAESMAHMLAALTRNELPESSGILGWLSGKSNYVEEFSNSLPILAEGLTNFASGLGDSVLSDDKIGAAESMTAMLGALAKNSIPEGGVLGWLSGQQNTDITAFANSLPTLAEGLNGFASGLDNSVLNSGRIDAAESMAKMLAALSKDTIPHGGVLEWITGQNDLTMFSNSLPPLAEGLNSFANSLDESIVDNKKVDAAESMAKILGSLAKYNIPEGGVIGWLSGQQNVDITSFANSLPTLAEGLSSFAESIGDTTIDNAKVESATAMASMLGALAKNDIPDGGGVLTWLTGQTDLSVFSTSLPQLATGLSGFAENLGDKITNTESIYAALDVAKVISQLQTDLNGVDLGGIFTEGTLEKFSQQLQEFGTGISGFDGSIKGVDTANMTSVTETIGTLKTMLADLGEIDTSKADAFIQSLEKLASIDISGFANSMSSVEGSAGQAATAASNFMQSFAEGLSSNSNLAIDKASSIAEQVGVALSSNTTEANQSGQALAQAFADGFSNSATDISGSAGDMAQKGVSGISKKRKAFADAGKSLATQLSTGFGSGASTLSTKAGSAAANAAAHVRVQNGAFYSAGAYICAGLANGINAGRSGVIQAAINVAVAAINAAKARLAVKSPSRVFFEIGSFVVQGFTNAMYEGGQRIQNAAVYMADNAINGMNNAVEKIANAVDHALDGVDPVITPVVDLAGVQASADRIDGMFGLQRPIDISGTINANMMAARESRTTDKDLLSAIKSIGRSKGDTNTFNITVDGAENPEDFADRLLRRMKIRTRTANG